MRDQRVGVIGLGEMGGTIAKRLHSLSVPLLVYDTNTALADAWPAPFWASTSAEVAEHSEVLLLIVATESQLHEVCESIAPYLPAQSIVVVHATVSPAAISHAGELIKQSGAALIDAGMSRGAGRMSEGSLTLFIGGDADTIERARPVLDLYSDNVTHAGPVGSGMVVKLCNNLALHGNRMILLEAARIAQANGVDPHTMVSSIRTSTGSSWVSDHWGNTDRLALGSGAGQTPMVERTKRELDTLLRLANAVQVEVPTAALVTKRLPSVLQSGMTATDRAHLLEHKQSRVSEWRDARDRAGAAFWSPLLVLTTTGAKTGRPRECVLEFMPHGDTIVVFGSNGGQRRDPHWIVNLRTHPRATVEIGPHALTATAVFLDTAEASEVYAQRASTSPAFVRYAAESAGRPIPVVRLDFDTTVQLPISEPK
ncbi:nitroreductase family deazaflavin-dependent oxidoreductase [Catelliglobosispora koreensis]|uniref:nitroreductase family deazaflavin-dependent oxidoreductase n=1 Tax=Catelliglobosispora koreensis TaxID=129052 RepID=UPI00035C92D8|nr:nitroreductase family deazaflavin-dependent oxidoreductase [Catelliglobosispora koreensis]